MHVLFVFLFIPCSVEISYITMILLNTFEVDMNPVSSSNNHTGRLWRWWQGHIRVACPSNAAEYNAVSISH